MDDKIKLMRNKMFDIANYSWGFCFLRNDKKTEETFKKNFPVAYEKIISNETEITERDMEPIIKNNIGNKY